MNTDPQSFLHMRVLAEDSGVFPEFASAELIFSSLSAEAYAAVIPSPSSSFANDISASDTTRATTRQK